MVVRGVVALERDGDAGKAGGTRERRERFPDERCSSRLHGLEPQFMTLG